ncbi:MAG: 50S ribosomal protein L25/general stress protein Ctc [Burkholderia sp.]|nr:50S ribosomal protein L25/general stress protein Ctc [Burkholderia sp.]
MKVFALERKKQGTGVSRRLRKSGKTIGIVYGGGVAEQMIELDHNFLWKAISKESFHASIFDLEISGKSQQVLLRNIQYHPFKQLVLHVDFQRIDLKKKLHKKVPIHFINAEVSHAIKISKAIISHIVTEIEVECLPIFLPNFVEVDLSNVQAGQTVRAKDISLPNGVELIAHINEENPIIALAAVPVDILSDANEESDI